LRLARSLNVKVAHSSAVELQLVLNPAIEGEWLGPGKIDAAILELLSVEDTDRDETAGLGMDRIACIFKNRDGTQHGRVFVLLFDLAGILRQRWQCDRQRHRRLRNPSEFAAQIHLPLNSLALSINGRLSPPKPPA
jgi:hypothetical protein